MKLMETAEQIRILNKILNDNKGRGFLAIFTATKEFFRVYVGEKSSYYEELDKLDKVSDSLVEGRTINLINSYITYLNNGLTSNLTESRRIQIDTVSDYLEQADRILRTNDLHPAAACIIIGASLEEFLRTWVESENISLGNSKPSLDSYAKALREKELINKQDYKDITSWAGLRNHAAHGEWVQVSDKNKIELMLQGVNLFMRQYS